jgi:hypothetical protein
MAPLLDCSQKRVQQAVRLRNTDLAQEWVRFADTHDFPTMKLKMEDLMITQKSKFELVVVYHDPSGSLEHEQWVSQQFEYVKSTFSGQKGKWLVEFGKTVVGSKAAVKKRTEAVLTGLLLLGSNFMHENKPIEAAEIDEESTVQGEEVVGDVVAAEGLASASVVSDMADFNNVRVEYNMHNATE